MTAPDYIQYIQVEHFDTEAWDLLDMLPLSTVLEETGISMDQFFDLASRGLINYVYFNGAILVRQEALEGFQQWLEALVSKTNLCRCSQIESSGQGHALN